MFAILPIKTLQAAFLESNTALLVTLSTDQRDLPPAFGTGRNYRDQLYLLKGFLEYAHLICIHFPLMFHSCHILLTIALP